jgi:hypothetical protein
VMVDTIKFSQMTSGGNINNDNQTPGLLAGANVIFNNPWTFLPPGTTAQRPTPSATINYRLRFNTDDQLYEYYDATLSIWTQLQESAFTVGPFITYTADANLPDAQNLGALANGILRQTITTGVATLDIAVNGTDYYGPGFVIPGTDGGTGINNGALTIDLGNATTGYLLTSDASGNATWQSASASGAITTIDGDSGFVVPLAGAVTISGVSTGLTFTGASQTLSLGGLLNPAYGGTGVNNGLSTLTLGGDLTTSGAFASTFTMTDVTNVIFPTSGTLATTSQLPTGAALTKTDDTNVTLLLGGTPATALLQATSLTLGWTGQLSVDRGGTGLAAITAHNLLIGNGTSAATLLAPNATSGIPLISQGSSADPAYGTAVVAGGGTGNTTFTAYSVICAGTTATGAFQNVVGLGNAGEQLTSNGAGLLPTWQAASSSGTVSSGLQNRLAYYAANGTTVSGLTGVNSAGLLTNVSGVPGWVAYTGTGAPVLNTLPTIITGINDSNGNLIIGLTAFPSAVNYLQMANVLAGGFPGIGCAGTDTNIGLRLQGKGNCGATMQGFTNGNAIAAGYIGEIISQNVPSASGVSLTTSTWTQITTISLTAGIWDVAGNVGFSGSNNIGVAQAAISSGSLTKPDISSVTGYTLGGAPTFENSFSSSNVAIVRVNITATTTVYLGAQANFVSGSVTAYGNIRATRVA